MKLIVVDSATFPINLSKFLFAHRSFSTVASAFLSYFQQDAQLRIILAKQLLL